MARNRDKGGDESASPKNDPRRLTPVFRGSFVNLVKARKPSEESDPRYSMMVMLDPENDDHMDWLDSLEEWVEEVGLEKWGGKTLPKKWKNPVKEMDEEFDDPGEFEGFLMVQPYRKQEDGRPGIVDESLEPIDDMDLAEEIYSGAWYRASIHPWAYDHKTGGKGVSLQLNNVMKIDDDDHLGGASTPDAEDDFADVKASGRSKSRSRGRRGR